MSLDPDNPRHRQAVQRLFERLELDLHDERVKAASGWLVVSVDEEDTPRRIVNALGPFDDPQTALLAAAEMERENRRWDETGWSHEVIPLFAR